MTATTLFTSPPTALPAAHGNRCAICFSPPAGAGAASPAVAVLHFPIWLLALVLLVGCAAPATRVLTNVNAYHYWLGEYEARCGGAATPECVAWYGDLKALKARITAAEDAVKRGGKLPLQLDAMKRAAKAAGRQ